MGRRIEDRLFSLSAVRDAATVLVFYSFGSEVPTRPIVERLLTDGKRVLLPYMESGDMAAAELDTLNSLIATTYGPKEPSSRAPVAPTEVDVVITPGLAFDRSGHRLGYGGGNYDRFLRRLGSHTKRIGIGFQMQLLSTVPYGPTDETVDVIVTDREIIEP